MSEPTPTDYTGMSNQEVKEDWADLNVHLAEYQLFGTIAPDWLQMALENCRMEMEERDMI